MYGTIARYRFKPGMMQKLLDREIERHDGMIIHANPDPRG